ncbi:MAG: tyrosine/phenylalanine carboxypeptidase domain-containing protein, partial [Nanobdellota archaeon]
NKEQVYIMNFPLIFSQLKKADEKLDLLSKKISFYAINPINLDEEKEKFFSSEEYNPQFKYAVYHEDFTKLREELNNIEIDESNVGLILRDIRDNYIAKTYMLEYRGDSELFTKYCKIIYGEPNSDLVKRAADFMDIQPVKEEGIYSSKEVVRKFRLAFFKYGFPWKVKEKSMVSNAAVNVSKKEILVKKNVKFSKNFLKRLIVHEVGTHVARADNGEKQPFLFFKRGIPGYLMVEEGLAVLNEEMNNCSNEYILKVYAGRVLAIDFALKYSFRETFNELCKHFNKKTAFRLTTRAKRGLSDTSMPGACTKDINYLKGYLALKDYIKHGGNLSKLYYGKIGLQHIELLDNIPGLINPAFLPAFRHINYLVHHFSSLMKTLILFPLTPLRTINSNLYRKIIKND